MPEQKQMSEAEQAELADRTQKFQQELGVLLGKYKLGLGAQAFLLPNGTVSAKPVLVNAPEEKAEEKVAVE